MLDSRIVTSPCGDASGTRGLLRSAFTTKDPPRVISIGHSSMGRAPEGILTPGARLTSLGVDRIGLLFCGKLGREIDRAREIRAALDRVWLAGHGIFEYRPLEGFLCRRLASGRRCDRPLHGQADIVVFGRDGEQLEVRIVLVVLGPEEAQ